MRDATAIAEAVRAREVSAAELAQEALDRAAADDLGAVWLITEERARREADAVDALVALGDDPGPLAGVPVGWKDLIDTSGIRTTYGSEIYRDHVPARVADVASLLAGGGAVCIAKLNTHELAWGTTSDNPWFGTCRNPHDPSRMPGGSSGGSGAAVASGIVALAPGTDTGGSIRCPSSVCGIVGLKPTFGRVSLAGIHPLCPSLDHCGDSSAQPGGGASSNRREPSSPTRHSCHRVWKKFASRLERCESTATDRPSGGQAGVENDSELSRQRGRAFQSGGPAVTTRLAWTAMRSFPSIHTRRSPHQVR